MSMQKSRASSFITYPYKLVDTVDGWTVYGVHTLTSVGIQALSTLSTIIGVLFENGHLVHHINCMKKRVFSYWPYLVDMVDKGKR